MKVDEIFALYLYTVAKKVNKKFYFLVLRFVLYFRECLNEIGWQKKRESDQEDGQAENVDWEKLEKDLFCEVNSAEHAPEISNEFVTIYC